MFVACSLNFIMHSTDTAVPDNKAMLYISIIITNEEKLLSGRSA